MSSPMKGSRGKRRVHWWLWCALAVTLGAWQARGLLRQKVLEHTALTGMAPSSEVVSQTIQGAADPVKAILTAWGSGHVVPRTVALQELNSLIPKLQPIPESLQTMLSNAPLDPDNGIREMALGLMQQMVHPDYAAAVVAQLTNSDPELRLMAMRRVRDLPPEIGMKLAVQHLEDRDPRMIGTALNLLGRWSHQDFGVRLSDTVSVGEISAAYRNFVRRRVNWPQPVRSGHASGSDRIPTSFIFRNWLLSASLGNGVQTSMWRISSSSRWMERRCD